MTSRFSSNGNGHSKYLLPDPFSLTPTALAQIVGNASMLRMEAFTRGTRALDPRRSIEDECGYPALGASIPTDTYRFLYERDAIAARVVEVLPRCTWQVQPSVYETEDEEVTPFEEAWDDLSKQLCPNGFFQDEQGGVVWEYLRRVDEQSRRGSYGLLLIGFDDGLPLGMPMAGVGLDLEGDDDEMEGADGEEEGSPVQPGTDDGGFGSADRAVPNGKGGFGASRAKRPVRNQQPWQEERPYFCPKFVQNFQKVDSNKGKTPSKGELSGLDPDQRQGYDTGYGTVDPEVPPRKEGAKVRYLRVFPEHLCQIVQFEGNVQSPRFGQPVRYLITLNDPREMTGVGLTLAQHYVHWSRVIHVAVDLESSEVFACPAMRPVLDNILNIRKVLGASAEGYWKSCFTMLSFETHPQLGGDVDVNVPDLKDMVEELRNGLQREMYTSGMEVKSIAPEVIDPTPFIEVQLNAICIKIPCPKRIFMGSERGELASAQDDSQFNDELRSRQLFKVSPRIVVPFVDRLIQAGVLPIPRAKKEETAAQRYAKLKQAEPEAPPMAEGEAPKPGQPPGAPGGFGGPPKSPSQGGFGKPGGPGGAKTGGRKFGPSPFSKNQLTPSRNKVKDYVVIGRKRLTANVTIETRQRTYHRDRDGNWKVRHPRRSITANAPFAQPHHELLSFDGKNDDQSDPTQAKDGMDEATVTEEVGVVETRGGYSISWPDLDSLGKKDRATIALSNVQAVAAYVAGGCEALVPPHQFLVSDSFLGMEAEEAAAMLEEAEAAAEVKLQAEIDQTNKIVDEHGFEPLPPEGFHDPENPVPTPLDPGQSLHDPASGKQIGANPHAPPAPPASPFGAQAPQPLDGDGKPVKSEQPLDPVMGKLPLKGKRPTKNVEQVDHEVQAILNGWEPLELEQVDNSFCPTGTGGGVDPTCSPDESGGAADGGGKTEVPKPPKSLPDEGHVDYMGFKLAKENTTQIGYRPSSMIRDKMTGEKTGKFKEHSRKLSGVTTTDSDGYEKFHSSLKAAVAYIHSYNGVENVDNQFCATGAGGGVDATCGKDDHGGGHDKGHGDSKGHEIEHAAHGLHEAHHVGHALSLGHPGDIVAIAASKVVGHAARAATDAMKATPGLKAVGHAIANLHEGATKMAEDAVSKMQARYGHATAAAILGLGSVAVGSALHGVGLAIPGKALLGAIPLIAVAEIGRAVGLLGPGSRIEKGLEKVGGWIHGIKQAIGRGVKAVVDKIPTARQAGRVVGKFMRDRGVIKANMLDMAKRLNPQATEEQLEDIVANAIDDDKVTMSPEELKAAAKEFWAGIDKSYADLLKEQTIDEADLDKLLSDSGQEPGEDDQTNDQQDGTTGGD